MADRAGWEPAEINRVTEFPLIDFPAEATHCSECGRALRVAKTRRRTLVTLAHGSIQARETVRSCSRNGCSRPAARSRELARIVPPFQRYGWDLIVHVGLSRFMMLRQRKELREQLRSRHGVELSAGTISALSDRFLESLERLHRARAPALRSAMEGSYPLHIDGTNETGRAYLFVCLDGLRGWVLNAKRVASERADLIAPVVDETTELFGDPVAVVRDMGKACSKAVTPLSERGVPDFVCHYHFVADLGRDLMRRSHEGVNGALACYRISDALRDFLAILKNASGNSQQGCEARQLAAVVYWVLNGPGHKTPRFPFGLPHLEYYHRVRSAAEVSRQWVSMPWSKQLKKWVRILEDISNRFDGDKELEQTLQELALGKELFDELRQILRLEADPTNARQPLLPEADVRLRRTIHAELDDFLTRLKRLAPPRQRYQEPSPYHTVLDHIAKYRDHLFGHPVIANGDGETIYVVDRTNNPLETLFAKNKQSLRRRTGRKYLSRDLEDLPAQATLVENLRYADYVRILCGSLGNLPEALACVARGTTPTNLRPRPDSVLRSQVRWLCRAHSGPSASPQMAAAGATGS